MSRHAFGGGFGRTLLLVGSLLGGHAVQAHDFWIEPERYRLTENATVAVTLRVGEHFKGETVPYVDAWIDRFELHDGAGVRPVEGQIGDDPAGRVTPRTAGASWIVYQSRDDFVELAQPKFRDYLAMEGMEYILPLQAERGLAERPAREYYVRCTKSLLWRAGGGGVDVTKPLGLTLEIVPSRNPYTPGDDEGLEVTLLHEGRPRPGLLVVAFTREAPDREQRVRTDHEGRAHIALDRPGTWIVKVVHMVAVEDDPRGQWRSYWASMTFAVE